ncbi:CUB domain-containing protein [Caenorhabditis elegans]|uniref:CUB domain-containing protein n=1 Tax=Caenorhabditis elegans TaxID=6239 RepID=O16778_CAEEL|nr:CUB domain-containing protein [Caenorhabditis elegans]CCD66376.1 CUB domain-containing protein [Caenorhabditis elegans]|eukprot:NP_493859.2 C-type LECtin [Caenorhabditis elegans]
MKIFIICLLHIYATFSVSQITSRAPYNTQTPSYSGCPDGFIVLNGYTCIQVSTTKKLFMDALSDCQSFPGGNLVSIHNSIDNKALAFSVTSSDPKWIGLICTETSSPCNWTDYSSDTSSYSNFVAGNPNLDVGNYVYMLVSGSSAGRWVSADQYTQLKYICEVPFHVTSTSGTPTRAPTPTPNGSVPCPEGFWSYKDNTCLKLFNTPMLYQDASYVCGNFSKGSNMVSVLEAQDDFTLKLISGLNNLTRPIWLGLSCQYPSASSCSWTDGSGTTSNYNNFAPGNPNTDVGTRAYMLTSGNSAGKWISSDGDYSYYSFFCEVPRADSCEHTYNGFCYSVNTNLLDEPDARQVCQRVSGDLVSIHSQAENLFLQSLVNSTGVAEYRIGAATDGVGKYWVDGSTFDYSNFGYFNPNLGKCSSLAMSGSVIPKGQWLSTNCNNKIPFICKHPQNLPTPTPTALGQCNGTQFLTGNGSFYSPGYPDQASGYPTPCTYIITESQGSIAQLQFEVLHLFWGQNMQLFSGIDETQPFAIVDIYSNKIYNSTTNVLKVVFHCITSNYATYSWAANYGTNIS